jgi:hypothetical protein
MATYTELRDRILAVIDSVAGVGRTHNRLRYAADWKTFLDHLQDSDRAVRGFWVERERREDNYHSFGRLNQMHTFTVRGVLGYKDTSDTDGQFGDAVDRVMDALGGATITGAWEFGPPTLRVVDVRQFGSLVCHYCEIEIVIEQEAAL